MSQQPKDYLLSRVLMRRMNHTLSIFIDESGDLGEHGSMCFSIVALSTREVDSLDRIVKRLRERKLKKKLKVLSEIKAYHSSDVVRRFVLERIARLNCSISVVVIPKSATRADWFKRKEEFYNHLCGLLFEHINLNVNTVEITIDKKHNNRLLREDFNQYIEGKIRSKRASIRVMIQHLESHTSNALQAVDFVAWAMNRKFSFGDSTFYDLISSKIENVGGENPWKQAPHQ